MPPCTRLQTSRHFMGPNSYRAQKVSLGRSGIVRSLQYYTSAEFKNTRKLYWGGIRFFRCHRTAQCHIALVFDVRVADIPVSMPTGHILIPAARTMYMDRRERDRKDGLGRSNRAAQVIGAGLRAINRTAAAERTLWSVRSRRETV